MTNSGAPTGDEQTDGQTRGMTRRSVVRTGTTAAWSVPVITVLAAAPAHAASPLPKPAALSITGLSATRDKGNSRLLNVSGTVANNGGTTQALQLELIIQPTQSSKHLEASTSAAMSGWASNTPTTVNRGRRFVYTSGAQIGASRAFAVQLTLSPDDAPGTLTATPVSTGGTSTLASTNF